MDATTARALLQRYLDGNASEEEILLIEQWYQQLVDEGHWAWAEGERQQVESAMEARLLQQIGMETPGRHKLVWLRKKSLAIAAVFILLIVVAGLFFSRTKPHTIASVAERYRDDVQPGHSAAVLTLSGGKTVLLDNSTTKTIGHQGSTVILSDSGQLVYQAGAGKAPEIFYNTLTTQKGNQYHLTLPDGTKVWLNAASSITYPTAFTGKERRVAISGEVYFEVMKNQQKPFIVQQGDMRVEVLGTSFNVNGYGDGEALRTTLVEGKVKVEKGSAGSILEPGQQAVISNGGGAIFIDHNPDIDAVLAWKNGSFAFKDAGIEAIMQQVQRWYNVDVVYQTRIKKHFIADIPRNAPLSQLLQLLEATDQVHFRIEGRKVFVLP
ncbi:FecR family protein [Chitinophaga sp.]|uniref:FecR family protein n=1 Tax=Chitinophaga sp. TaxID=1869181 RepID=UPI002F9474F0